MAQSLILLSVVLIVGMVLANLPDRTRSGGAAPEQPSGPTAAPSVFGNPVSNWSFEQSLDGWRVLGPGTDAGVAPQGRTSGSCALLRSRGPQPARIGLAQDGVVKGAGRGARYVAKAWVRSSGPGLKVTLRLVGSGARPEGSQTVTTTLPGMAWRAVIVAHTVQARTDLGVELSADAVAPGDALLVDEVTVRQG